MAQPKSWPVTERTSWEESPSHCPTRQLGAGSHPCLSFFSSFSQWHTSSGCHQSLCPCPGPLRTQQGKLRAQTGAGGELQLFPAPRSWHSGHVIAICFPLCRVMAARTKLHEAPAMPRSQRQHPPQSKVSTGEQPSLASSCQQHL